MEYLIIKDKSGNLVAVKPTMIRPNANNDSVTAQRYLTELRAWNEHINALPPMHLDPSIKGKEGDWVDGIEQWQCHDLSEKVHKWIDCSKEEFDEDLPWLDYRITLKAVGEKTEQKILFTGHTLMSAHPDQSQEAQRQGAEETKADIVANLISEYEQGNYKRPGEYAAFQIEHTKFLAQLYDKHIAAQPAEEWVKRQTVNEIFAWLLGYTDFPERNETDGKFYWRTHLRRKLFESGIEFIEPEHSNK